MRYKPLINYGKTAYYSAFIPLVGLFTFMIFGIYSLILVGKHGCPYFRYLEKGIIVFFINAILVFCTILFPSQATHRYFISKDFYETRTGYVWYNIYGQKYKFTGDKKAWYLDESDNIYGDLIFDEIIPNAHWTAWYSSGEKAEVGEYYGDHPNNKWSYWYKNGNLKMTGNYYMGSMDGLWVFYYPSGNKKRAGTYNNRICIGKWSYWDESGKLIKEEIYDDNGKLISTKEYPVPQQIPSTNQAPPSLP